ncbi:MAG: glycosyltransferase family 39 protein [Terriglobales bacterium]
MKSGIKPGKSKKRNGAKTPAAARWRKLLPSLAVLIPVALAVLAYLVALNYPFIYDDIGQVLKNPSIQSWHNLPRYFTHNVWSHLNAVSNYYRPIFLLWMLLNFSLFGANPEGWHLASILLHAAATALVYLLARRDLKDDKVAAGFCAAIFAVHPIHVECVTWISGVTEPLLAVLFLGCVLCYRRWLDNHDNNRGWYAASLVLCALALLSKETAVVIVPTLLFYEMRTPRNGALSQRVQSAAWALAPFAILTAVYLVVRSIVLKGFAPDIGSHVTKTTVLLTLPDALWFYLHKLLWPSSLSVFYPFAFVERPTFVNFIGPALAVLAIAAGLWLWARRQPAVMSACMWILFPLIPPLIALGRFVPSDLVHDRYLYLPSIGFAMLVAMALRRIRFGSHTVAGIPVAQTAVLAALVVALSACTIAQSRYWSNGVLLYARGIEVAPHSLVALHQMAALMSQQKNYPASRKYLEQALEAYPDDYQTLVSVGVLDIYLHDCKAAIPLLSHATEVKPAQGTGYFYLGMAQMGIGQSAEAEASLRRATHLLPHSPRIHYALGIVLLDEDRDEEAQEEFLAELQVDPNSNAAEKLQALRTGSPSHSSLADDNDVWNRILGDTP